MKNIVMAAALVLAAGSASAQLYSNFGGYNSGAIGLSTGTVTGSGVAAPSGFQWSELQSDATGDANGSAGFIASSTATPVPSFFIGIVDDFVIPEGQTWKITSILTYVYGPNSTSAVQPVIGGTINIWSGTPDAGGTIIASGTFATSINTNIYRVFNSTQSVPGSAPGFTRLVREVSWNFSALSLGQGTYWIDVQYNSATTGAVFSPSITLPGTRGLPSWNGRHRNVLGIWDPALDRGSPVTAPDVPQDFPFIIIPSPGAFALLGMGGLLAARRRR